MLNTRSRNVVAPAGLCACVLGAASAYHTVAQDDRVVPGINSADSTANVTSPDDARSQAYQRFVSTQINDVDFVETPLRDAIALLSSLGDVDLIVNWDTEGMGDGLDPDARATISFRHPVALVTVVEELLQNTIDEECSWVMGDGYIRIGTKEMLNEHRYVRVYPIEDLLHLVPEFDDPPELDLESVLGGSATGEITVSIFTPVDSEPPPQSPKEEEAERIAGLITATIEPLQWERHGGTGGVIQMLGGTLVVSASDYIHRQVVGYSWGENPSIP